MVADPHSHGRSPAPQPLTYLPWLVAVGFFMENLDTTIVNTAVPTMARELVKRHVDKLIYGSDCNDSVGVGTKCSGSQQIATMRKLAPDASALRKIFELNAKKVMKV